MSYLPNQAVNQQQRYPSGYAQAPNSNPYGRPNTMQGTIIPFLNAVTGIDQLLKASQSKG